MNKKNTLRILTIIFVIGLTTALIFSYMLTDKLMHEKESLEKNREKLELLMDSISEQNKKLMDLRGDIEAFWTAAENSGKLKDYTNYFERAMEYDNHYAEALQKMNTLANHKGYVQITDSNGDNYLEKIKNINTDDVFYRVIKAMRIRNGVIGHPDFDSASSNGDVLRINDVVKNIKTYKSGSAEWAEIRYQR